MFLLVEREIESHGEHLLPVVTCVLSQRRHGDVPLLLLLLLLYLVFTDLFDWIYLIDLILLYYVLYLILIFTLSASGLK